MAVTGLCGHRNLHCIELRLLPCADLFAATPGTLRVRISNRQRYIPVYLLEISIADHKMLVPALAAGGSEVVEIPLTMPRRGRHQAPPLHISSCFPVNFFVRSYQYHPLQTLLVFPRPLATPLPVLQDARRSASDLQIAMPGGDGDLRSIEDYRPGDPPRAIHWKLSARHDSLKTRQLNRQASVTRMIDPQQFDGPLEERLGRCAYLVNRCFHQHCAVGLVIGAKRFAPALGRSHQLRLLKELALYE
jgi:uncharacterized protein (DUF58 family)